MKLVNLRVQDRVPTGYGVGETDVPLEEKHRTFQTHEACCPFFRWEQALVLKLKGRDVQRVKGWEVLRAPRLSPWGLQPEQDLPQWAPEVTLGERQAWGEEHICRTLRQGFPPAPHSCQALRRPHFFPSPFPCSAVLRGGPSGGEADP